MAIRIVSSGNLARGMLENPLLNPIKMDDLGVPLFQENHHMILQFKPLFICIRCQKNRKMLEDVSNGFLRLKIIPFLRIHWYPPILEPPGWIGLKKCL